MLGMKEMAMIGTGKNLIKKYKNNFSEFMRHDFFVRIQLVDSKTGLTAKIVELPVNAENWMDYINKAVDLKDYKVMKVEFSADGR